jgi:hypothetical protein
VKQEVNSCVCKLSRLSAYLNTLKVLLGQTQLMGQRMMGVVGLDQFVSRAAVFSAFRISSSFLFFVSARKFKSTCTVRMSHRNLLHSFYEIFKKPILMYSSSEFRSLESGWRSLDKMCGCYLVTLSDTYT